MVIYGVNFRGKSGSSASPALAAAEAAYAAEHLGHQLLGFESGNGSDTFGVAHWCDDGTSNLDILSEKDPDLTLQKLKQVLSVPVAECCRKLR